MDIDEPPAQKRKKRVAELKWKRTSKIVKAKKCALAAIVLLDIPEDASPLLIFEGTTSLNELKKHIYNQTNLYGTQNGREFATDPEAIFRHQLYHVNFKSAKCEVLLEC